MFDDRHYSTIKTKQLNSPLFTWSR